MNRVVSLILVDESGAVLGELPPFEVATPWWQNLGEIDDRYQVLRLLHGDRATPPGGHVTYLAQTDQRPDGLRPVQVELRKEPKRAAYAEPGGPAASIAWARETLGATVTAHQTRTWNLSAIWRFDDDGTPVAWLKQVPAFFAHEPAAIRLVEAVAPGLVPPLLAVGPHGRMLLAHVPGADRYGAGAELCAQIAEAFHPVQEHFCSEEIGGIPAGPRDLAPVARPYLDEIDGLRELIDDLPRRWAEIDACGLPDTLVHGDLHPGNVRTGPDGKPTIMDWGDCSIGHPGFDILRLTGGLDPAEQDEVLTAWAARWTRSVPGSDPRRAAELLRPVAALRDATVYAGFVAAIEPAEAPYHASDVPAALAAAASIVKE
ncbi:MAG: phosphotransferase [Actinoplanes sp.]